MMENSKLEEKEIYEVDSKKYTVITRISEKTGIAPVSLEIFK